MAKWRFCIADIATNHGGLRCATVDLNDSIWVWDLTDGSLVSKFESCYSSGGRRLAIDPSGTLCIAGNYQGGRIEAYSVEDGSVVWRRKRLHKVQRLAYDARSDQWMAVFVEKPLLFLKRDTGKTAAELPSVFRRSISPYDEVVFVDHQGYTAKTEHKVMELCEIQSNLKRVVIQRHSPAVLDVAFGPGIILIAEMSVARIIKDAHGQFVATHEYDPPDGGPLRAVSILDGRTLWEHRPGKGRHFLRVAYNEKRRCVHGLARWEEDGVRMSVVSFDVGDGRKLGEQVFETGNYPEEFALRGEALITSRGEVFDLTEDEPRIRLRLKLPE